MASDLIYTTLTRQDKSPAELQPILDLSNQIFGVEASAEGTHHSSLSEWVRRLSDAQAFIASAATLDRESTSKQPVGFMFVHPKQHTANAEPVLHIWLAGVLPAYRGEGVFHRLMTMVEEHALQFGAARISVATYPKRFEKMYSILSKTGWEVTNDLDDGKILLMKSLHRSADS
jgi:GNAT superfamily N-acetyltransferase